MDSTSVKSFRYKLEQGQVGEGAIAHYLMRRGKASCASFHGCLSWPAGCSSSHLVWSSMGRCLRPLRYSGPGSAPLVSQTWPIGSTARKAA